jgi:hypothetical protein
VGAACGILNTGDQGLLNPLAAAGQWVATQTPDAESTILWMQALGCDAIYVSNMQSQEEYKDFKYPLKFAGVLPVLYDNHQGDMIFRVPRRYLARARVVQTAKLNAVQGTGSTISPDRLRAYVDAIENGADSPATLKHMGPDIMEVHATIAAGQSIIVQETYDSAWQAWSDGKRVPVHKDAMNMMMLEVSPGNRDITLAFITPLENQLGRALAALTLVVILTLLWSGWRSERHRKNQGLSEPINRGTP